MTLLVYILAPVPLVSPLSSIKVLPHASNTQGVGNWIFIFPRCTPYQHLYYFVFYICQLLKIVTTCIQDSKCFLLRESKELLSCYYSPASCIRISKRGPVECQNSVFFVFSPPQNHINTKLPLESVYTFDKSTHFYVWLPNPSNDEFEQFKVKPFSVP